MSATDVPWEIRLPASVMQFFCLLHNLRPRDPLWTSPTFLHALAAAVYPMEVSDIPWIFTNACLKFSSVWSH